MLGTAEVARAKPDGYTLMHGATYSITVEPLVDKQAGYTAKSFTPICQTFKNDQVVVVPPNSPLKTARDLVEAAKKKAGRRHRRHSRHRHHSAPRHDRVRRQAKVSNSTTFRSRGRPRKSRTSAPGRSNSPPCRSRLRPAAACRCPAMFAETRNPSLPNVPTFKEQGFDVAPLSYGGLLGPAGMPAAVAKKLETACIDIIKSDAAQRVVKHTFQPADYFADAAGFTKNLAIDAAEKNKLVPLLHPN